MVCNKSMRIKISVLCCLDFVVFTIFPVSLKHEWRAVKKLFAFILTQRQMVLPDPEQSWLYWKLL